MDGRGFSFWYVDHPTPVSSDALVLTPSQEGIFTVLFGIASFFFLPRTPAHTLFLTDEEKRYIESCLIADGTVAKDEKDDYFSWFQVARAFKGPHVLLMALCGFFSGCTLYALA